MHKLVSSRLLWLGHLNQFHPFCEQNKVLESKNDVILKDQLNYLNGLIYYRTFTDLLESIDMLPRKF